MSASSSSCRPSYANLMVFALSVMQVTVNASYQTTDLQNNLRKTDICIRKQTCGECIQNPECAWCSAPNFRRERCFSPHANRITMILGLSEECSEEFIVNPGISFSVLRWEGDSFSSSSPSDSSYSSTFANRRQEPVQLEPHEVTLTPRVRQSFNVSFHFTQAQDFPVDVYYLTNFKQLSIENGTNNNPIIESGELLVQSLRNVTSNFRLGFGSAISILNSPSSAGTDNTCGLKNIMSLSQDTGKFADSVRNFTFSENAAACNNGGLDAILQALVCRQKIGWRSESQKILVFASNTEFSQNIDTLNAEAMRHAELCHLNERGFSTNSSSQGLPTVSHLNEILKRNAVNIVWLAADEHYSSFERLANSVEGSTARKLNGIAMSIPDLIQERYHSLSRSVEIKDTASEYVEIKYFSKCLEPGEAGYNETARCDGLKVGDRVQFLAAIEATECPIDKSEWHQKFDIYPIGTNERLTVDLRMICDCDCENREHPTYETQSATCNGAGTLKCGNCECNPDNFGKNCECGRSLLMSVARQQSCRPDNTSSVDCYGRGTCICGHCECSERPNPNERLYGQFCECDNFSCDQHNGILCSGNGDCNCGLCMCHAGWSGGACECSVSNQTCIGFGDRNDLLCSGHGECICGECVCRTDGDIRYSGRFCQREMNLGFIDV